MSFQSNNRVPDPKPFHRWHRRIGVIGAVFFMILSGTGLLLNHTEGLGLGARYVQAPLVLDLYRIAPPREPLSFQAGEHIVSQVGTRLYLDVRELPERTEQLVAALEVDDTVVIAIAGKLLLLSTDGEIIERLDGTDGVPAGMRRMGRATTGQRLVVQASHGDYALDLATLGWSRAEAPDAAWAEPAQVPAELRQRLIAAYRGTGLPLERIILDLHSGRILGDWGVYLVDAAAALFLTLVATGLWMWVKRR